MSVNFKGANFRFIKQVMDLTNEVEKILNSNEEKGTFELIEYSKTLEYTKMDDKIDIIIGEIHFCIDKEPICFYNENNECLFKIYDSSDTVRINNNLNNISSYYNFYSEDNILIPITDIIPKKLKKNNNEKKN